MFVRSSDQEGITINWPDFTLLLPAVSIGNVGQLAIDLVISALGLNLSRIGYFHDACILSMAGNDPFYKPGDHTGQVNIGIEVFKCEEHKLIVIQQRAPLVKGCQSNFCNKLVQWIKDCSFKQVVLLSSISAVERLDAQIQGSPLRYILTEKANYLQAAFNQMSWKPLEKRPTYSPITAGSERDKSIEEEIFTPGGGITKMLLSACSKEDVPLAVLLAFCSEGDNVVDAVNLFLYLNDWLKLISREKVENSLTGKPSKFDMNIVVCDQLFTYNHKRSHNLLKRTARTKCLH